MHTMDHLFEETLKDVYFAEKAILKALPKMASKTTSPELKSAFEDHVRQTEGQVDRLEQIFKAIGKKAQGKECPALKGLVQETEELIAEEGKGQVLDAGLIGCAQAVEHYEMARYGTLRAWAEQLGHDDVAKLLQETLDEERATDQLLTELSLELNAVADEIGEDGEGDDDKKDSGRDARPRGEDKPERSRKPASAAKGRPAAAGK